jgi:hypothetical protein
LKRYFVVFLVLSALHTWPLVTAPAHLSRNNNADTILNEWTVAWVAHQIVRDPVHLFNANIFYPDKRTLAMSENLIAPALMGAPLLWLGASPVLTYNLLLLLGFALTGWTTFIVVSRWTGDRMAGLVSGSLLAFNAHSLTRLPHLQAIHAEFIPLALLALDDLVRERRVRHAVLLALWFVLNGLTSIYLMVFLIVCLTAALVVRTEIWASRAVLKTVARRLALAAAIAAAVLLPVLLPYYRIHTEQGLVRPLDEVAYYSAGWRDYLLTGGRLHWSLWAHRIGDATALFPGVTALVLGMVTLATGIAFRDRRARMCLAIGVAGVLLSFGPAMPGYTTLYETFPPMQALRASARFGWLALLALALLAGFAVAHIRARWIARPSLATAAGSVLLVLVNVEALRAPIGYTPFDRIPDTYARLAAEPPGAVIEFPIYSPLQFARNAGYMLNSTAHWKPLVNGYSGFVAPQYGERAGRFASFPRPDALAALRTAGVRYAVVHASGISNSAQVFKEAMHTPGLSLLWEEPGIRVFRIE